MSKKALLVTTISGFVPQFEMNNVRILQGMGYEVHYAANYKTPTYTDSNKRLNHSGIVRHQVNFVRSPFHIVKNVEAYFQLKKIMKEEQFQLVHCHTPMGGALARLAAKKTQTVPVIYTAHGFHFYKGASVINWIVFYTAEKWLAKYTDGLITMNQEDFKRANRFRLRKGGNVFYINGVGIYLKKIKENIKNKDGSLLNNIIKGELNLPAQKEIFKLVSVGELSKRKNHMVILEALDRLQDAHIVYVICGKGALREKIEARIEESEYLKNHVILAGYRTDVKEILMGADCFVFPSLQEGLPVAVMEAMAMGLPVIASKIRGNTDLVVDGKGGYLIEKNNIFAYEEAIRQMLEQKELRNEMGKFNQEKIKEFSIEEVEKIMRTVYERIGG